MEYRHERDPGLYWHRCENWWRQEFNCPLGAIDVKRGEKGTQPNDKTPNLEPPQEEDRPREPNPPAEPPGNPPEPFKDVEEEDLDEAIEIPPKREPPDYVPDGEEYERSLDDDDDPGEEEELPPVIDLPEPKEVRDKIVDEEGEQKAPFQQPFTDGGEPWIPDEVPEGARHHANRGIDESYLWEPAFIGKDPRGPTKQKEIDWNSVLAGARSEATARVSTKAGIGTATPAPSSSLGLQLGGSSEAELAQTILAERALAESVKNASTKSKRDRSRDRLGPAESAAPATGNVPQANTPVRQYSPSQFGTGRDQIRRREQAIKAAKVLATVATGTAAYAIYSNRPSGRGRGGKTGQSAAFQIENPQFAN